MIAPRLLALNCIRSLQEFSRHYAAPPTPSRHPSLFTPSTLHPYRVPSFLHNPLPESILIDDDFIHAWARPGCYALRAEFPGYAIDTACSAKPPEGQSFSRKLLQRVSVSPTIGQVASFAFSNILGFAEFFTAIRRSNLTNVTSTLRYIRVAEFQSTESSLTFRNRDKVTVTRRS